MAAAFEVYLLKLLLPRIHRNILADYHAIVECSQRYDVTKKTDTPFARLRKRAMRFHKFVFIYTHYDLR